MWKAPGSPWLIFKQQTPHFTKIRTPTHLLFTHFFNKIPHEICQTSVIPVPAFQSLIIHKKLGVGEIQEGSTALTAMTNPCGLLGMTSPLCSSLPNIFMCSSAPEDFASLHLLGMHRETVKCNSLWMERLSKIYINLPKKLLKKPTKPLDARESKLPFAPWRGWSGSVQRGWQTWPPS